MNTRRPTKPPLPPNDPDVAPKQKPLNQLLVLSAVLACLAGGSMIVGYELMRTKSTGAMAENGRAAPSSGGNPMTDPSAKVSESADSSNIVDDDGKTMWMSPTSGPPLDLAFLPPGCQIIVALRPADFSTRPQAGQTLLALGPITSRLEQLAAEIPFEYEWDAVRRLLVGFQMSSDGKWSTSQVVDLTKPLDAAQIKEFGRRFDAERGYKDQSYWVQDGNAYYFPTERGGHAYVVAPEVLIRDIIDLGGESPPLRRDVERLLPYTDADRPLTIVLAPNFLFSEGRSIFSGAMARLREPLFWFLGDSINAVALSVNWDENFFIELLAMPTLDMPPGHLAREMADRVAKLPELVEDYVLSLDPQPYGRQVVVRFPGMLRKLANYTRGGVEADHVVLRCYLPAAAGHNLMLGAELTLAEAPTMESPTAEAKSSMAVVNSIAEALKRPTSLRFARDSLDAALYQLSQDIGVEIIILGPDLQSDGITRNQQLALDIENRPAEEILIEILRSANPDKTAAGPADPRQKLVYVVKPKAPGGAEVLIVTTRARATERGDELPPAFVPNEPE